MAAARRGDQAEVPVGGATGPIDGRFGPLTRRAIEDYEARVGLPISGLATQILLKRLETTTSASAAR